MIILETVETLVPVPVTHPNPLLESIKKRLERVSPASIGMRGRHFSKEVLLIAADVVYNKLKEGDSLVPDSFVDTKSSNPFSQYGLDYFDGNNLDCYERTDLINIIKRLVEIGYWWKMAASIPAKEVLCQTE